ncbi:MAG: hypothetical protein ABI082_13505 [Dokdonella sp.]
MIIDTGLRVVAWLDRQSTDGERTRSCPTWVVGGRLQQWIDAEDQDGG